MPTTLGRLLAGASCPSGSVDGQAAEPEPLDPEDPEEDDDAPDDPPDEELDVDGVGAFVPEAPSDFLLPAFAPSDVPLSDLPPSGFPPSDLPPSDLLLSDVLPSDRPEDEAARESLR